MLLVLLLRADQKKVHHDGLLLRHVREGEVVGGEGGDGVGVGLLELADGATVLVGAIVPEADGGAAAVLAIALQATVFASGAGAGDAGILEAIVDTNGRAAALAALGAPLVVFADGGALAEFAILPVGAVFANALAVAGLAVVRVALAVWTGGFLGDAWLLCCWLFGHSSSRSRRDDDNGGFFFCVHSLSTSSSSSTKAMSECVNSVPFGIRQQQKLLCDRWQCNHVILLLGDGMKKQGWERQVRSHWWQGH